MTAAYTAQLAAAGRTPVWLVEMATARRCANTYASAVAPSTCTASDLGDGARCYFSRETCQDAGNFRSETFTWRFLSANSPAFPTLITTYPALLPLVKDVSSVAQAVDLAEGFNADDKCKITLYDVGGHGTDCPPFDLDKSPRNTGRAGMWWLRWLKIWPNFRGNTITVKRGFVASGFASTDFESYWTGTVEGLVYNKDGTVTIDGVGLSRELEKQVPPKISSTNTLQADLSRTGTTVYVDDASEFTDPAAVSGDLVIEVQTITGRYEKMLVTARDTGADTLTVTRAYLGTPAEPCRADAIVREVLAWNGSRITTVVNDILERCGVPTASVDTSQMSSESLRALGPVTVTRTVREPTEARKLVNELLEPFQAVVFQDDDLKLNLHANGPAYPSETVSTVTDDDNIKSKSAHFWSGETTRLTHAAVLYGWDESPDGEGSTDNDGYSGVAVAVNGETFVAGYYGGELKDVFKRIVKSKWIREGDDYNANGAAVRMVSVFGKLNRGIEWEAELKDATMTIGSMVSVTSALLTNAHGTEVATTMAILGKKPMGLHSFQFTAQETGYSASTRWGFIAPAGAPNFGAASTAQKLYAYIGNASNLMSDGSEGYSVI